MTILHDLFWGSAYIAGVLIMFAGILAGFGFLVAAFTKKR